MSDVISALKRHVFHQCGMHGTVLARIIKRDDNGGIDAKYCCGRFETNYHVPTLYELLTEKFALVLKEGGEYI